MSNSGIGQFIPLILIFVIFYFFLIRPQQKKAKDHKIMVENLKRGDKVITSGGIVGKVDRIIDNEKVEVEIIKEEALRCDSFYVNHRWYGGLLTNWKTVVGRISTLKKLEDQEETVFPTLPKKEAATLKKQLHKLRVQLNGVKNMDRIPDIMIIIDQNQELTAVREAMKLNIPIISILDSNCDPDVVDVPIPGNDDAISSIRIILEALTDSIKAGRQL